MRLFQNKILDWVTECFGSKITDDKIERNHRFLEEALELVQACNCTISEAHQLVDYVYGRSVGEKSQEVGGVMVTLAALCSAQELDMMTCGYTELERIMDKDTIKRIREKHAAKPKVQPKQN